MGRKVSTAKMSLSQTCSWENEHVLKWLFPVGSHVIVSKAGKQKAVQGVTHSAREELTGGDASLILSGTLAARPTATVHLCGPQSFLLKPMGRALAPFDSREI